LSDEVNKEQLVGQIRFALQSMGEKNEHHRFEDLCRAFARERIAPNILPATGPVAAGGDQGRDFETFRSFLREELGPHGAFAAALPDGPLAFTCTLQVNGLPSKIRNDLTKILAEGTEVVGVYAFCAAGLAVAGRHELQAEARTNHDLKLEVLDGLALAEALADRELFWIAEEFLSIPAVFRPAAPESEEADGLPQWYRESRERWRRRDRQPPVLGEVSSVIDGLRHATFNPDARGDLPLWLALLEPLAEEGADFSDITQRARYEVSVARLRGLGDMRPADEAAHAFLDRAIDGEDPAELADAATLLSYAGTASLLGHSDLEPAEVSRIGARLRERLAELVAAGPPPTARARLLETQGHICVMPDPLDVAMGDPAQSGHDVVEEIDRAKTDGVPDERVAAMPSADIETAMAAWRELADLLEETPLFPVEAWADMLEFLSPRLVDEPGWDQIQEAVDAAIERLYGGAAAAERARDRGLRLKEAGRLCEAINEFHKAKIRWWSGDSLRGALLSMLMIAETYKELHLPLAGKQYALAVAGTANTSGGDDVRDLLAHALMVASEMDYAAGAWASAVELADLGLVGHAVLLDPEEDSWGERDFQNSLMTIGLSLRLARQLVPEAVPLVEEVARRHDMLDELDKLDADLETWEPQRWSEIADEQLLGRPFSDLGPERRIGFAALGLRWTFESENQYRSLRACERIAAAAQLLAVELVAEDLCLIPADLEVVVSIAEGELPREPAMKLLADGVRRWSVELSPVNPNASPEQVERIFTELLATLTVILTEVSLLSSAGFFAAIKRAFENGLSHKLAIGRPFDEMAEVLPEERFATNARRAEPPLPDGVPTPSPHAELRWQDGPGPTYDHDEAKEMIARRYERIPPLIPRTLELAGGEPAFLALVDELRSQGWRDWHILQALANLSINHRLEAEGLNTHEAVSTNDPRIKEITSNPEAKGESLPDLSSITGAELDFARRVGNLGVLKNWGLEPRASFGAIDPYSRFLAERYAYWSDDVPHANPFPVPGS
jgi:tetratricopeptide (TPR) repeat protein